MNNVIYSKRHNVLITPYSAAIAQMMPDSKDATIGSHHLSIVPNDVEHVRVLRNLGRPAPSTVSTLYNWRGDIPFQTQRDTAALLAINRRAYVLSEMGTGKTRAALHATTHLRDMNAIRKVLIVGPLSTLTAVWEYEIARYFLPSLSAVLHGSKKKRLQQLARTDVDYYIINHDGVHTIADELIQRRDIDCVIVDELAAYRNRRSRRWKALNKVCKGRTYMWGLTGSPTPNSPADAYGQIRLITPSNVTSFRAFQDLTMHRVSEFIYIPRKDAHTYVHAAMQPAVRFTREQCVELPDITYVRHSVPLSEQQTAVYKELVKKLVVDMAQWALESGRVVARNEGIRLNKLLQVCAGFVYDDDRKGITLDCKPRLGMLDEVLCEASRKVIVFVPFVHGVEIVSEFLRKRHWSFATISGKVSKRERDRIFRDFQHADKPRVLVAHPQTMAHGLTLTAANTIVWYSPPSSLEIYEQANARIRRPGQTAKQLIVHLESTRAESRVYSRLERRAKLQGVLLDLFEKNELTAV